MKYVIHKLLGLGATLALFASAASAVTIDFATSSGSDGTIANTRNFSGGGVNVSVTAWSRESASSGGFAAAAVGQYGTGLGVVSSFGFGGDSDHEIDNIGRLDFLLFSFSTPAILDFVRLEWVGEDSDFQLWISSVNNLNTIYGATVESLSGGSSSNTFAVNASNVLGSYILLAAQTTGSDLDDTFKVRNIQFTIPTSVPEGGSTTALLGLCLTGLVALRRRIRK